MKKRLLSRLPVAAFVILCVSGLFAQSRVDLNVDASESWRYVTHVQERVSARPGRFGLYYPKWIPGEHKPSGPLNNMVNLRITANGKPVTWTRDDVDMFAFWCDVPKGVTTLDVTFDDVENWADVDTANLARIKWNRLLLYPKGVSQNAVKVTASLKVPDGWQYATALQVTKEDGSIVHFGTVDLEQFVDSPAIIGKYFRKLPLSDSGDPHEIDIAAENAEALNYKPETLAAWKDLIVQADKLFGAHHYKSYKFLVTLSDVGASEGLEHHQSSEDGVGQNSLSDPQGLIELGELLGHEYAHSWNGKYRRPAGLATPDFEQPMKGELLWVYEGLTQYLGYLLAARSGMWTPETFRDYVADTAMFMQNNQGRRWRPLVDTARSVQLLYGTGRNWRASRRSTDYYWESMLVWLEADTIIRQRSGGKKSLDDFLKAFHGGSNTGPQVRPYTQRDVVLALNAIMPYDWNGFFKTRVYDIAPEIPLGGITNSGWRLVYTAEPNPYTAGVEKSRGVRNFLASIGFSIAENAVIEDVRPGSPAALAGLSPNMVLVDKDGKDLKPDAVEAAIKAAAGGTSKILFTADVAGVKRNVAVDYNGGIRYPHLVRIDGTTDLLSDISRAH
jgi:predicted metalloprotease with PDZ domain